MMCQFTVYYRQKAPILAETQFPPDFTSNDIAHVFPKHHTYVSIYFWGQATKAHIYTNLTLIISSVRCWKCGHRIIVNKLKLLLNLVWTQFSWCAAGADVWIRRAGLSRRYACIVWNAADGCFEPHRNRAPQYLLAFPAPTWNCWQALRYQRISSHVQPS